MNYLSIKLFIYRQISVYRIRASGPVSAPREGVDGWREHAHEAAAQPRHMVDPLYGQAVVIYLEFDALQDLILSLAPFHPVNPLSGPSPHPSSPHMELDLTLKSPRSSCSTSCFSWDLLSFSPAVTLLTPLFTPVCFLSRISSGKLPLQALRLPCPSHGVGGPPMSPHSFRHPHISDSTYHS